MSIPNSIKGLWHCCKCGLTLLSLCLQAVGLICSHICKICSCILHLGRASQPLNQHLELQNLGLIPAEPEQRVALQAGSKTLPFFCGNIFPGGTPELSELRIWMCRGAKGRTGPLWWLVCHSLTSPAQALDTRHCFKNLMKMHHHHLSGACLAKDESPLYPLHNTRGDFTISRSSAIQIHLHHLASSPPVQEWQPATPALQAVLQKRARLLCWSCRCCAGCCRNKAQKADHAPNLNRPSRARDLREMIPKVT